MSDNVIINGEVLLYEAKAPYIKSGASIKGALEYDPNEDKIRCHECGEWFSSLAAHIVKSHDIYAEDYKLKHGLKSSAALVNEHMRMKFATNGKRLATLPKFILGRAKHDGRNLTHKKKRVSALKSSVNSSEYQNQRRICPAQLLERIRLCADAVGHTPTGKELKEHGVTVPTLCHRFGSLRSAMLLAGLVPRKANADKKYSRKLLIEMLRNFIATRQYVPTISDCKRGLLPGSTIFIRYCGSWTKAIQMAGYKPIGSGRWKQKKGVTD